MTARGRALGILLGLAVLRFDFRNRLGQVTLPTLVVCGTRDRSVKPEHARALADGIPKAKLQRFPGAGHLVVLERAEQIAPAVTEFAASCALAWILVQRIEPWLVAGHRALP